jgi:hypothetical protein
MKNIDC